MEVEDGQAATMSMVIFNRRLARNRSSVTRLSLSAPLPWVAVTPERTVMRAFSSGTRKELGPGIRRQEEGPESEDDGTDDGNSAGKNDVP